MKCKTCRHYKFNHYNLRDFEFQENPDLRLIDACSQCSCKQFIMEEDKLIGITGDKQSVLDGLKQLKEEYGGTLTLVELIDKLEHQYE